MWWMAFVQKATYVDAFGKRMEAYRVGMGDFGVAVLPPSKDFGDFVTQSYPAHMFMYYWFIRITDIRGKGAVIIPLASSIAWEVYEERVLGTSPVSLGDIVFGALGGILAEILPENIVLDYRITPSPNAKVSYPNTGNPSLDTLIYKLNTNYTPFSITLKKISKPYTFLIGFSYAYGENYPYNYPYKPDSIPSIEISTENIININLLNPAPLIPNSPTINLGVVREF
ncbi:MAG: hypothetical protein ABIL50_00625 [candidate division WOR-3 bacterium]